MKIKRIIAAALTAVCILTWSAAPVSAKTISSAKAEYAFFYATNAEGKAVLLRTLTLDELKELAHGQENGENYWISTTDNYPTTQYCEARGLLVEELVDYVKTASAVSGADTIGFSGGDTLRLMATDGYGNYSRSWTWEKLYGEPRYYFEGLYSGWNLGWEVTGEDNSKSGVSLEEYSANYQAGDPFYEEKRAVFEGGIEMPVILAVESCSGRTTSDTLTASTEPGIASYLAAHGGIAAGSLKDALTDDCALRLCLPMTEADLMTAHRTAYDNFKWIYNLRLDMETAPSLPSQGTVDAPVPTFQLDGNTLIVTLTCATEGASIYYGSDGAPQTLYTGPFTLDVSGQDLSASPVTLYAAAVREGWDDTGMQTFRYPGMAPSFQTVYSGMADTPLTFSAAEGVTDAGWADWTGALTFITMKSPAAGGYVTMDPSQYILDNAAKAITFDRALFPETGSYSFLFHASKYADKGVSVTIKQAAPELKAAEAVPFGSPVTVEFDSAAYQSGLSVYVTPEGGSRTLIASSSLDRTQAGQVTVKADYFALPSSAMPEAGTYTLELVNNSFTPATQTVTVTLTGGFSDVPAEAWYWEYVTDLSAAGVVNGVGDGKFSPDGTLTWGEALKLLLLAAGYEEQAPAGTHWASGYLDRARADGLTDYNGELGAAITRLDFCRAAAKALGAETSLTASPFPDTEDPAALALYELGIISGMGDGTFSPEGILTRSQISKMIWCILHMEDTI